MFPFEKDGFSTYCVTWLLDDTLAAPEKNTCKLQSTLPLHIPAAIPRALSAFYWLATKKLNSFEGQKSEESVNIIWIIRIHCSNPSVFAAKNRSSILGIGLEEPRGEGDSSFISAVSREISRWTSLGENWRMSTFFGDWEIRSTMDHWF